MRSRTWTWKEGDRAVLCAFESGAGLTMRPGMRLIVGRSATLAWADGRIVGLVGADGIKPYAWPSSALEPEGARSIWPTGTTRHVSLAAAQRAVDMADAEAWCARPSAAAVRSAHAAREQLRAITQAEHVVAARTRGIAEGRRLAAARMRRFVAWLKECGAGDFVLREVLSHISPEASVYAGVSRRHPWVCWLYDRVLDDERSPQDCPGCHARPADIVLGPEWAALPWQREAGR